MSDRSTSREPIDCAALRDHVETLSVSLAIWGHRDDSKPQAEVRREANTAVEAIDAALTDLHRIRARLVDEIRQADDATISRADALLDRIRAEREQDKGGDAQPAYPAPGSRIPDQPGYVVGECGHRVAGSEWRAGFRNCERCGS